MATPGYTEDLPQPNAVTIATQSATASPSTPTQFSQSVSVSTTVQNTLPAQATPTKAQNPKTVVLATPSQTQYVTAEIQSSSGQQSNRPSSTPQYIVVTVTDGSLRPSNSVSESSPPAAGVQTGIPTQVVQETTQQVHTHTHTHTIDHTPERSVFIAINIQHVIIFPLRSGSYPFSDSPLYSQTPPSSSSSYYEATTTSGSQVTPVTSQSVSVTTATGGGGSGYVLQSGYILGGGGNGGGGYSSHNTRAAPATVQWLCDNYEGAEGVSLPRCTLYCHYLLHCQDLKLEPVNAASFGKLIRSVFMGLRTRRLGTRGNSKYHYYGLRIKATSSLLRLMEDQQHLAMRQQPLSHKHRIKPVQKVEGMTNGISLGSGHQQGAGLNDISAQVQQYQQFLDASRALPEFPEINLQDRILPDGIVPEHITAFQQLYREHCEAILDVMVNLQLTLVETLWRTFWRFSENNAADTLSIHGESEDRLPKWCLVVLCKYEPVLHWTRGCDNTLYQALVEILIPDVLRPIPSVLTQAIRNFAKSLESWLTGAMMNIPEEMVRIKVVCAGSFAQTLRRYTSLNHLAQAARAVLQNTAQINQMLSDLNRVDFNNVQEQASWVCRCEDAVVQRLEQDFKQTLQQHNSLEQWASWLDAVVSQVLKPYHHSPDAFPKAAKLFLLRWSFYSSMVIRDLTLRSAASFGSFHLIRLLYDEYMYYLVEHRVAQAKGETPIAVMGEFASVGRCHNSSDPDKDEEEDDDEESDEECGEMTMPSNSAGLGEGEESLEPPVKLTRTDPQGLFNTTQ
uniref:RFX-type winged-helix domain-containing protein n=1 Tax=Esox lucius TaxID=8010 RepID=A0A3P9A8J7_ESOLU